MVDPNKCGVQVRPCWGVAWLVFVVAFAVYWPLRSNYLCDPDSPGFAHVAVAFEATIGSPHPPGYTLWVLATACLARLVGSPNTAMILLSIVFTASAGVFFLNLASRLQGFRGGLGIAALFLLTPNVLLYSAMASTYTVDLFVSCVIGWFAARVWQGDKQLAPWAAGILGLLAGVRPSGVVLMLPLLISALWVACRTDWRIWARSVLFGAAALLLWFIPVACFTQGLGDATRDFWLDACDLAQFLIGRSVFADVPAESYLHRLTGETIWLGISLVVPSCLCVGLWCVRKSARLAIVPLAPRPVWHNRWFYTAWLLPNLVITSCFHCPKPGYLNLTLPPLLLCLGNSMVANLRPLSRTGERIRPGPCLVTASIFLVATAVLASFPFGNVSSPWFERFRRLFQVASLQSLRESDQAVAQFIALMRTGRTAIPEQMVIVLQQGHCALGGDASNYYFPACPGCDPIEGGLAEVFYGERIQSSVPLQTKRIWWNLPSGGSADGILAAFPHTKFVLEGDLRCFYLTEIGPQPLDVEIRYGEWLCPLYRAAGVELGRGFGDVETDDWGNYFIWAMGPECELKIGLDRPMQVRLILEVLASPIPGQEIQVSFNSDPLESPRAVKARETIRWAFDAPKGVHELRFAFRAWNGSPSVVFSTERRPLALSLRQINITLQNGRPMKLLPDRGTQVHSVWSLRR